MTQYKKDTVNNQSIQDWMRSNRLYEEYLFQYLLIIFLFVTIGFFTLGFEISGYSLQQNLFFNFLYFLLLTVAIGFTSFWYKLIFGTKSKLEKRTELILEFVEQVEDKEQREAIKEYLKNDGGLPPRRLQKWALIFLGWCFLFEIFFVTSWVKDMALVWQPDWVNNVIAWVQVHTQNLAVDPPGIHINKPFTIWLDGSGEGKEFLRKFYDTEQALLSSDFGQACSLFHAWHTLSFFPILCAYIITLWQLIGWTGGNQVDSKNQSGVKSFIWLIIITFFMTLMLIGGFGILFMDLGYRAPSATGRWGWLYDMWLHIGYFFIIIALRIYVGWFFFFKSLVLKLFNK